MGDGFLTNCWIDFFEKKNIWEMIDCGDSAQTSRSVGVWWLKHEQKRQINLVLLCLKSLI